jgi:hypothetical protein
MVMRTTDSLAGSVLWKAARWTYHDGSAIDSERVSIHSRASRKARADGGTLYRAGLWPRLTPDEVREQSWTDYHITLTRCSKGVNGWDYICEPPADPKRQYDKVGVMGSVFGIGSWSDLPPGPVPDRSAYEAEARARYERMRRSQR